MELANINIGNIYPITVQLKEIRYLLLDSVDPLFVKHILNDVSNQINHLFIFNHKYVHEFSTNNQKKLTKLIKFTALACNQSFINYINELSSST